MARIAVESYMVRYPLGGMMSWVLQYVVGFHRLGHDVYFVERSEYPNECFDPERGEMSDDCSYGLRAVEAALARFGLKNKCCFVDARGRYHGLSRRRVEAVLKHTDVFVQMAPRAAWLEEAADAGVRVLIDGDPGFRQIWMDESRDPLDPLRRRDGYDFYFTTGRNVGSPESSAPTAGVDWRPVFHPVVVGLFDQVGAPPDGPFTTVMNWRSYAPVCNEGAAYGQKDVEFAKFLELPRLTSTALEVAVAGNGVPIDRLRLAGWRLRDAHAVTASFDSFRRYIQTSRGEFSVCKHGYVATRSAWFSDRSSAYLASGRPVVLQETGFSAHLPCGEGLFAVRTPDEAALAIEEVSADYKRHANAARDIALEYLDAPKVLGRLLDEIGV